MNTKEGAFAVQDAIDFIKRLQPLKPIYWNRFLSKVSDKHA